MHPKKTISITAALALATGVLFVPGGTFARGAGGTARGPVFGFQARIAAHRPFQPARVHRVPARLGWQLHWWNHRHRDRAGAGAGAIYPALDGGTTAPDSDVTGSLPVPGPSVFVPRVAPSEPPERVGCFARGYDVPRERGGVAHVTVIRC
jgi:hypothetical protein